MKIGYLMQQGVDIYQPPFDGPALHIREVISELEKLGHQVRVLVNLHGKICESTGLSPFVLADPVALDRGIFRLLERLLRRIQTDLQWPYVNAFDSWRFALACCQELGDCDILYERLSWQGYGGALAARWLRRPLIVEYNGDHLEDLTAKGLAPKGLQRWLALRLMRWAVWQAARVVATGAGWRESFIRNWGVAGQQVVVVENGTTLTTLLPRHQLRAFASRPEPITTLVYLGNFHPLHGIQTLIRAFAQATHYGLPMRLVLIGAGFGQEEAQRLVTKNNVEDQVVFMGHLSPEEFPSHLAAADIGVSPYCGRKEYTGLKLYDYKAAGLAIIASGENGQPAALKHKATGWIVPPCDEAALTDAILQLARDWRLRQRLGQAARLEAEQFHGWDHTAQQLDRLFHDIESLRQSRNLMKSKEVV